MIRSTVWGSSLWKAYWVGFWKISDTIGFSVYWDGSSNVIIPYVYNPISELYEPATGPMDLNKDCMTGTFTPVSFSGNWEIETKVNVHTSVASFDYILRIEGTASEYLALTWNGVSLQLIIVDAAGGAPKCNITSPFTLGVDTIININKTGTVITLSVEGKTPVVAPTVDLTTNGCNFDEVRAGCQASNLREIPALFYYLNIDVVDNWDFVTRLPLLSDPNGNKLIGSVNSIPLTLTDDTPFGAYYPYLNNPWPTAYRVSDNP